MNIRLRVTVNDAEAMIERVYEAEIECDRGTTPEQAEALMSNTLRMLDRQAAEAFEDDEDEGEQWKQGEKS